MAPRAKPPHPDDIPVPINPGIISTTPCDARCPGVALVFVERQGASLAFCGHCFDNRWAQLFGAGWAVREDLRTRLREQEARR